MRRAGARRGLLVREEVSRTAQHLCDEMRADGPAAWMNFLADRDDFYMAAHGGILFPSRAATDAFVTEFAPTIQSMDLRWANERILVLTEDRAVFSADWTEEVTPVQGPSTNMAGYFSGLIERMDAGWRVRTTHGSDLPPPDSSR